MSVNQCGVLVGAIIIVIFGVVFLFLNKKD